MGSTNKTRILERRVVDGIQVMALTPRKPVNTSSCIVSTAVADSLADIDKPRIFNYFATTNSTIREPAEKLTPSIPV